MQCLVLRAWLRALTRPCPRDGTAPKATNDTLSLIKAAQAGVARTWREAPGGKPWRYSKAGVVTTDLMALDMAPRALIGQLDRERSAPLMAAMDACNARFGRGSVVPARAGLTEKRIWSTKFEMRSPRYTTQLSELPVAYAQLCRRSQWVVGIRRLFPSRHQVMRQHGQLADQAGDVGAFARPLRAHRLAIRRNGHDSDRA